MGIKVKDVKINLNQDKIRETINNAIKERTFDVTCPFCNNIVKVPAGKSFCPSCGNELDLTLNIKYKD